jgi:hypothetical protein
MGALAIAQYTAAAVLFTVALMHWLIWLRLPGSTAHLLFAFAAMAAGGNAVAELGVYRAATIETMAQALKWYVAMSALW